MKTTQYAREMVLKGSVKLRFSLEDLDLMRKLSGMVYHRNSPYRQSWFDFRQLQMEKFVREHLYEDEQPGVGRNESGNESDFFYST
jgi:hypothetical protein